MLLQNWQLLWYLNVLNGHMVKILKLQCVIKCHPLHQQLCVSEAYFFLIAEVYFKKIWWLIENRYFFHMAWNKVLDKQKIEPSGNNRWQCFKDEEMKAWIASAECQQWQHGGSALTSGNSALPYFCGADMWPKESLFLKWKRGKWATCHAPAARHKVSWHLISIGSIMAVNNVPRATGRWRSTKA